MASLTREQLRDLYRYLLLTRGLEDRLERLLRQGFFWGGLYRSLGQEATAVGAAAALEAGDWLAPSLRDTGALLVRGVEPVDLLRQYLARAGSPSGGKDSACHFSLPELHLLGPIGPLGPQVSVLAGVALALRLRRESRVCLTFLGDGASRTGVAHEGFNFAAVQRLPVVIVLVHNRWAFSTRSDRQAAVDDWLDVAAAYGVPAASVDGNDVLLVHDEVRRAVDRSRRGEGTMMVVAETYRMAGHAEHDPQSYVAGDELAAWRARDPIDRLETYLVEAGFESRAGLAVVKESVRRELEAAVELALSSEMPEPDEARFGTCAADAASVPWTRCSPVYEDLQPPGSEL